MREAEKRMRGAEQTRHTHYRETNAPAGDPQVAYWLHYDDIVKHQRGKWDYSQLDGMIGIRLRVAGYNPSQVMWAIATNAPIMRRQNMGASEYAAKYHNRDWSRYARETTENFVFGSRGAAQFIKAEPYRPYYMVLEGRNTAKSRQLEAASR
jgi:hypothetical protein